MNLSGLKSKKMNLRAVALIGVFLITLFIPAFSFAQHVEKDGSIKGTITTSNGKPAAAVTVFIKEISKAAVSEEDGSFILKNIKAGSYQLEISLVGNQSVQQLVRVENGKVTEVNLQLNVSDKQLEDVIISTSHNAFKTAGSKDVAKMPLSNLENPQVYATVSKELLQQQGFFSADDAIKNAAGISKLWSATNRAGDGGAYYTLRGFTTQSQLRNGLAGTVTSTVDAANLERVEIIKGPSGTLFGNTLTSYGGLINRVTKKPYEKLGGEIAYSGGSYGFNRMSADINTPLDTAKRALLRINTAYNGINSFQDNGFNRNFAFDPSFSYKINDRLTLSVEAEINHNTSAGSPIYYFGTTIADLGVTRADQLNVNYYNSYQSNDLTMTSNVANFFGTMDYKISGQWKSQTSFSTTSSSSSGVQPYFYLLANNDSISRNVWTVDGNASNLQIQQNFIGDFTIKGLRNRIVAGIDFLNQKQNIRYVDPNNNSDNFDKVNLVGAIANYDDFNKDNVNALYQNTPQVVSYSRYNNYITSAYVSDVLNITDNLMAMASVRVNYFNSKPVNNPASGTTTQSFNQTTFSPKFGLVYQVIKDKVALFGNYMNGFNNPGYYLKYDATTQSNVNTLFKSEQANQWEGGVKLDVFDGKLSSTISYYDIKVKNKVRSDANHANAYIQDGEQYSKGVEAEVSANPFSGFNIIAGYAHNTSLMEKSTSYDNGRRPQTAGPANTANLWLSYTIVTGAAKGMGIGFGGNYASDNQVINNSYNGVFTLPSYTVLNTGVFYNQDKFRIAVNVNNLTDKKYWVGYTTVNPQMLRQIIGSIAYKF